ncbi:hypothetical protein AMR41_14590 [Hapalosiphon sp. MRB220]|nr:hypothetical protein AMR41_14590 [Hapalosiphon sp. MRB220]
MLTFKNSLLAFLLITLTSNILQLILLVKTTFASSSEIENDQINDHTELLSSAVNELQLSIDTDDIKTKVVDFDQSNQNYKFTSPTHLHKEALEPKPELSLDPPEFSSNSTRQLNFWQIEQNQQIKEEKSAEKIPLVIELERQQTEEKPILTPNIGSDPNYIISPRIAPKDKINPFTTTLPLNGIPVSHLTEWEFVGVAGFGDEINTNIDANATFKLTNKIQESLTKKNVFTVDQKNSYLQLQTVRENREVLVAKKTPQTLLGMEMQMSLTASCLFPETTSEQQCTYTPGLEVDRNSLDDNFLVPTRIVQTANVGDVMTPESLAYMRLPGFQMGANGQKVGVNLYFPNAGALPGNSRGNDYFYVREENIDNTPTAFYSRVRQIVRANDKEAVLGRTVRGFGFIVNDDNILLNSALQLGNFVFPDANPQLKPGNKKVNTSINRNLFLAANNARIPVNSFTFYHAGIGRADSLQSPINNFNKIPSAKFNSIWIGLSPIIDRRLEKVLRYETFGPRNFISQAGAEGGVDSNVNLVSVVNSDKYSTSQLQDFYTQLYLSNFSQDAYFVNGNKLIEETNYYPHLSFSGNITSSQDVFRYYSGVITGETIKAYLGGDWTRKTLDGWNFNAGGIGYINPDRDYYSQLLGGVSKAFRLSRNSNLVFSTAFNYALDQEDRISDIESKSNSSYLTLGTRAKIGDVSFGLVNYFGNIFPDSIDETLLLDLSIKFNDYFLLSGYYSPINENSTSTQYGATAQLRFGKDYNSPTLSFSWTNNDYDLGRDPDDRTKIHLNDNVYKILFRLGAPSNPFDQVTAERLRQQINNGVQDLQRERNRENPQQQQPNPVAD